MRGWSLNTWVVEWVETSTKSEREGFQDGSETCWVWFGDCGTNEDIGSQAEGGRDEDAESFIGIEMQSLHGNFNFNEVHISLLRSHF